MQQKTEGIAKLGENIDSSVIARTQNLIWKKGGEITPQFWGEFSFQEGDHQNCPKSKIIKWNTISASK